VWWLGVDDGLDGDAAVGGLVVVDREVGVELARQLFESAGGRGVQGGGVAAVVDPDGADVGEGIGGDLP